MSSSPKSKCKKQTHRQTDMKYFWIIYMYYRGHLNSTHFISVYDSTLLGVDKLENTDSLLLSVPDNLWLDENSHQGAKIWNFSYSVISFNYFEENRNFYTS